MSKGKEKMSDTVGDSIQDASKEPFCFLTNELGVIVCSIGASTLEFPIRHGKDISSLFISQGYMDMTFLTLGQ